MQSRQERGEVQRGREAAAAGWPVIIIELQSGSKSNRIIECTPLSIKLFFAALLAVVVVA